MTREPDFRDLVGEDLEPEEEERLRRVHDLLLQAGPPPELPPALAHAPDVPAPEAKVFAFPRAGRVLAIAAAFVIAAFFAGYITGHRGGFSAEVSLAMHGTAAAPQARGVLDVGKRGDGGNVPLEFRVSGLKPLPKGQWYEMYLTRNHHRAESCGPFNVERGETLVRMNVPYDFEGIDGWVVTRNRRGSPPGPTVMTT